MVRKQIKIFNHIHMPVYVQKIPGGTCKKKTNASNTYHITQFWLGGKFGKEHL